MPNKCNEILDKLEHCLLNLKQTTLVGPNFNSVDELCVDWLKLRGYSVHSPKEYPSKITKSDDIISLFYLLFEKYYPGFNIPYNKTAHDRKLAKMFIESRMAADGISRDKALEQCASIVENFFRYKDKFEFEAAPNFGVFGQANMGWLTNRIVELMNKDMLELKEEKNERLVENQTEMIKNQIQSHWSSEELDKIYRRNKK